ncbi:TRAP-type mannitol/chloroaromatic compound transport system permease small subunit [Natronocella acetinitrilica]|uniref:TRAP transporter small permease protein n=1 Tax=Natronocella acetinitrilica TaxID=414046 RepID=A0AAE3G415_9GAMM|nr:TRAP transporter small permease subunit [Natronocella acetinitrilica]MCP1675376.1 TRAP-type mannitol/chloroaromatic compound transport system permease small subunit [Natronocella acetinitrilica]
MRFFLRVSSIIDTVNGAIGRLMGAAVVVLVLLGVINVVGRYLGAHLGMQLSSNALLEGQTYAYNLIFLLGAAYVLRQDGHIRVDILYSSFGPKPKAWIDLFGALLFLIPFCALVVWLSWDYTLRSWGWTHFPHGWPDVERMERSPQPGGLPRYPIKTVIPLAFFLLMLQGVSEAIKRIAWLSGVPGSPLPGRPEATRPPRPESTA